MKKNLILTAVAVMAVGQIAQAAAGGGAGKGEGKPEGARAQDVRKASEKAAEAAVRGADSSTSPAALKTKLNSSGLSSKLNPNESAKLGENMSKSADVQAAVKSAMDQQKDFPELAEARVRGLSMIEIKGDLGDKALQAMSADARAEAAVQNLLLNAGEIAKTWTPETRENLTFLLKETVERMSKNVDPATAIKEANAELLKVRKVRLDMDQVNKFCKKA